MKRRAEFLVDKRDGRREWLRRTKLAHSIHMAFHSADIQAGDESDPEPSRAWDPEPWRAGDLELWRAMDLASAVLTGLRSVHGEAVVLTTDQLAVAVHKVLVATGFPQVAGAYEKCGAEHRRRRWALSQMNAMDVGCLPHSHRTGMVWRPPADDPFRG